MIALTGSDLCFSDIDRVVRQGEQVQLAETARQNVLNARQFIHDVIDEERVVYGITTGFGKFSDTVISTEYTLELQENLIMSHAVGVGEPFSREVVRGIMLLRVNNLVKGYSGIGLGTTELLIAMLNRGVHPVIPSQGSVGASGDLAPLAHMVLVMIGRGEAFYQGERMPGSEALKRAGLEPVTLGAKEGLALINGTQAIASLGAWAWLRMKNLLKMADISAAMTIDALEGRLDPFQEKIYRLRPHPGHGNTAENLRNLLMDSQVIAERQTPRVQDAYTLRCVPQVHGASKDAHRHVGEVLVREINATTDNPLVFPEEKDIISGGNFHGQPLALPLDYLSTAIAELGNIAERRIERLLNPSSNFGLPPFLIRDGGVSSGFMILQYTAASLVSENKTLAHPASVDSIPTSANQEDHVSMGTTSARKALEILANCEKVLAIEAMCAAQALDQRAPRKPGKGTEAGRQVVRERIAYLEKDRELASDIEKAVEITAGGDLVRAVEAQVGALKV